jgi:vitamin B12 transporter
MGLHRLALHRAQGRFTRSAANALAALMIGGSTGALAQAPVAQTGGEARQGSSDANDAATIVVTGTAVPVALRKIGNSITVIGGEAIDQRHSAYLPDILREVPGVAVNQGGSFGGLSQIRLRGGEGNHVLVLIDGIEVAPAGSGEFDFSSLLANDIDRVEVLRGPMSGLYGSNALAGVINVITRGGDGPAVDAAAEYGAFDSRLVRAGVTLGDRETFVAANAVSRRTDGFSSAAIGTEADGDRNTTLYLRGGARLADAARIDATARFVDKKTQTDGFDFSGGPLQGQAIDDDSYSNTKDWSGGIALTLEPVERWKSIVSATYAGNDMAAGFGSADSSGSTGHRLSLAARSTIGFDTPAFAGASHHLTLFIEREEEAYRNTFPLDASQAARQKRILLGYGAEYRIDLFERLFLRGAIRHDDNDRFRDATTFSLAGSLVLGSTRLHASYGTGVTNPTFIEQFGYVPGTFVGNPALLPEKAKGFDAGMEQRLLGDRLLIDLTYFRSDLTDEILSLFPTVVNDRGRSRRRGIELSGRFGLGAISLGGSYTYLDARDPDGTREVRRPGNQASFDVTGRFGAGRRGSVSAGLIHNGKMLDDDFRNYFNNGFVAGKSRLNSYSVARLSASYRVTGRIELFGRLENAFDEKYQEAISYAAPGRAAYGGVRLVLP